MTQSGRDISTAFAVLTALAAFAFGLVAMAAPNGGGSETDVSAGTVLDVSLADLSITPAALRAPAGPVTLRVTNDGASPHDLHLDGTDLKTAVLDPGGGEDLDLGELAPGTYTLACEIPGHRAAGMEATLTVTEAGATAEPSGDHAAHGSGAADWRELDRLMAESLSAFPAETEGRGGQALEPAVLADGTKHFELTASIVDWEVEPGKVVEAWAYNGQVPGPTIKVQPGDRVRVTVHNELPISTDVHWHGIDTPFEMDGVAPLTQEPITPGSTFVYELVAEGVAVGMYHAHHHGHVAVLNGLLGTFLVGDLPLPAGVSVSQEVPMVLSDAGTIGFGINGKSFPATEPVVANQGDWVLVHYLNEGLTAHPMHLHQLDQLVIAKDGFPLAQPYLADTVNVAPGERYSVLIRADDPGTWVWHCHILTHAERDDGLFGMVTAMVVEPTG